MKTSLFFLSNFDISGNDGFYSSNVHETPQEVKLKRKLKFEPKLMVWAAMSPDGISKPYIVPSGQSINQDVYIEKCLRDRLLPFIQAYHRNDEIVFWPELAASHYAKRTTDFLESKKISNMCQGQPIQPSLLNYVQLRIFGLNSRGERMLIAGKQRIWFNWKIEYATATNKSTRNEYIDLEQLLLPEWIGFAEKDF